MEENNTHTLHIGSIRSELNRIVDEWLHLHFRLTVILVACTFIVEICMTFFIAQSDILTTTIERYILKFILAPSGLAGFCLLITYFILHRKRISHRTKIYVVSMMYVLISFIYFTAHSAFITVYTLYTIAIFLTTTYADYRLTSFVSALSIVSLTLSELFLRWDVDKITIYENANRLAEFLVAISVVIGSGLVSCVTIHYERQKNETSLRREVERELLKESMLYDELTGILNRKALHEALKALEKAPPTMPLVFGITDIDHFKSINDLYGHNVGDLCLMEFSCILCEYFGDASVYRYGGDEFCLILRNTTITAAEQLCERVQQRFRRIELEKITELKPTVSFGLTAYEASSGVSQLFHQADEMLYEAKLTRNAIRTAHHASDASDNRFHIFLQENVTHEPK